MSTITIHLTPDRLEAEIWNRPSRERVTIPLRAGYAPIAAALIGAAANLPAPMPTSWRLSLSAHQLTVVSLDQPARCAQCGGSIEQHDRSHAWRAYQVRRPTHAVEGLHVTLAAVLASISDDPEVLARLERSLGVDA